MSSRLFVFSAFALAACGARYEGDTQGPWTLDRPAFNELSTIKQLGVLPLDYSQLQFKTRNGPIPEAQAIADKSDKQRQSWEADKAAMLNEHGNRLLGYAGSIQLVQSESAPYVLESAAVLVEPGWFAALVVMAGGGAPAELTVQYRVVRQADRKIVYEWKSIRGATGVSSGVRLRFCAAELGEQAFRMLRAFAATAG